MNTKKKILIDVSLFHNLLSCAAENENIQNISIKNTICVCPLVSKLIHKTKILSGHVYNGIGTGLY